MKKESDREAKIARLDELLDEMMEILNSEEVTYEDFLELKRRHENL